MRDRLETIKHLHGLSWEINRIKISNLFTSKEISEKQYLKNIGELYGFKMGLFETKNKFRRRILMKHRNIWNFKKESILMSIFKKIKLGFGLLTGRLNYDDLIKMIVKEVNAKVDIPKLTEKQEEQLFTVVLNSLKLYFLSK